MRNLHDGETFAGRKPGGASYDRSTMSKQPDTRDELDRMLQQASRRVRFGDLVSEPAADQTADEQEAADEQQVEN